MTLKTKSTIIPTRIVGIWNEYSYICLAFLILAVCSIFKLIQTTWQEVDQAHGPLILFVVLYLFFIKLTEDPSKTKSTPRPIAGFLVFISSMLIYVLGKSQDIVIIELCAYILLVTSLVIMFSGLQRLKALWFPIFFMIFMVPLPGFVVGAITMPMKIAVSTVAENILYFFDFPIARTGVILQIGQYQLLVADACAGMHTLISLEALGLLYLNLVKHDSFARNLTLALLIVPISFTANTIRVIAITLVTFYWGDDVGQGFVHGFAGMILFLVALVLIIALDTLIQSFIRK